MKACAECMTTVAIAGYEVSHTHGRRLRGVHEAAKVFVPNTRSRRGRFKKRAAFLSQTEEGQWLCMACARYAGKGRWFKLMAKPEVERLRTLFVEHSAAAHPPHTSSKVIFRRFDWIGGCILLSRSMASLVHSCGM